MPRSLAAQIASLGFTVRDVRDIGLRGRPDEEIFDAAIASDSVIITRDRGFTYEKNWPAAFTAGIIFVNLPDSVPAGILNQKILDLLSNRLPESVLGALTFVEQHRALSRIVRRRS